MKNTGSVIVLIILACLAVWGIIHLIKKNSPKYKNGNSPVNFGQYSFGSGCGMSNEESNKKFSYSYPGDTSKVIGSTPCSSPLSEAQLIAGNDSFYKSILNGSVPKT